MTQKYIGQITDTSAESGDDLADRLNDFDNAHRTNQSGATRPAGSLAGAIWTRVVAGVYDLMMFNGTKDVAVLTGDGNLAGLTDTAAARAVLELTPGAIARDTLGFKAGALAPKATTPQAEAGADDTNYMTSLKTAQAIAEQGVLKADKATTLEAQAGVDNTKWMTPARVADSIGAQGAFGDGYVYADVAGSRTHTTWYYNTTGYALYVAIGGKSTTTTTARPIQTRENASAAIVDIIAMVGANSDRQYYSFVVPPNAGYRVLGGTQQTTWVEGYRP